MKKMLRAVMAAFAIRPGDPTLYWGEYKNL